MRNDLAVKIRSDSEKEPYREAEHTVQDVESLFASQSNFTMPTSIYLAIHLLSFSLAIMTTILVIWLIGIFDGSGGHGRWMLNLGAKTVNRVWP